MMVWLSKFWKLILGGNIFERAFDIIDKKFDSEVRREELKASVFKTYLEARASWLSAGGFWLILPFTLLTAFHYGAVVVYSVFWCADCVYPKEWTIAALPGVMAEQESNIILASIGVLGLFSYLGRKR